MKKQSMFLYVLRLSLTLLAITAVMAALLAGVNKITAPAIAKANAEKTLKAIETVLPGGGEQVEYTDPKGAVKTVYASDTGYAVHVVTSGFEGEINMMVGVDPDGKLLGISIISHSETAGLGAVAADSGSKGQAFRDQFVGKDGSLAVSKDGGEIDALTGATITSRAVTAGVNTALECVKTLQGG